MVTERETPARLKRKKEIDREEEGAIKKLRKKSANWVQNAITDDTSCHYISTCKLSTFEEKHFLNYYYWTWRAGKIQAVSTSKSAHICFSKYHPQTPVFSISGVPDSVISGYAAPSHYSSIFLQKSGAEMKSKSTRSEFVAKGKKLDLLSSPDKAGKMAIYSTEDDSPIYEPFSIASGVFYGDFCST
jgi:hypothetical protein